jgi:hypothetical protein
MKITSLTIETASSYSPNAGQLVGKVRLEGPTGSQEVVLSNSALSRIFGVVGADITESTRRNALMTKAAVDDAVHGPLLEDASRVDTEVPF